MKLQLRPQGIAASRGLLGQLMSRLGDLGRFLGLFNLNDQKWGRGDDKPADASKPDGTPQKLLDVSRLTTLGWTARTALEPGIHSTNDWMQTNALHG